MGKISGWGLINLPMIAMFGVSHFNLFLGTSQSLPGT